MKSAAPAIALLIVALALILLSGPAQHRMHAFITALPWLQEPSR